MLEALCAEPLQYVLKLTDAELGVETPKGILLVQAAGGHNCVA